MLKVYEREQGRYGLVLTDYDYKLGPGRTGLYVAERVFAITKAPIPVVLVSALKHTDPLFDLILQKPFKMEEAIKQIEGNARIQDKLQQRRLFYAST